MRVRLFCVSRLADAEVAAVTGALHAAETGLECKT
jgi:hypothetical protein